MPAGRAVPAGGGAVGVAVTVANGVGLVVGDELLPPHWTMVPRTAAAPRMITVVRVFNWVLILSVADPEGRTTLN
jgi:hypothetical protein